MAFGTYQEPYLNSDIARILKEIINIDRDIESIKQMLSLKTDFNLEDCFRLFDVRDHSSLNLRAVEETFTFFQIYPRREELQMLMLHFDKDADGELNWNEFSKIFLPRDKNYSSLLSKRQSMFIGCTNFSRSTCFLGETLREFISYL